ncbi:MAG TPA: cbb3-type cytochrome c oxidase subunit I [Longimicrobiales bacterium]|nr:cbb3-type cytochrome c oxidase subunit I [Longimicrobiales bacterium]
MGMEPFVRNFIRASLVWLGVGILLGVSMAFWPAEHMVYRPAHAHANLLGFVSMMIFGVAYHVLPRFSGSPLWSRRSALVHLWVANLGLSGLVAGWVLRAWSGAPGEVLVRVGGTLSAVGGFLFIVNIWNTLGPVRRSDPAGVGARHDLSPSQRRPGLPLAAAGAGPGNGRHE